MSWIQVAEQSTPEVDNRPVYLLRKEFDVTEVPASVLLRASAHGLYTVYLNGVRVGNDELTPGFTEYAFQTQFQTYEVAAHLRRGRNAIVVELADGWYRGTMQIMQIPNQFGERVELWIDLDSIITTDASWLVGKSHILNADLLRGQVEDLRLKDPAAYLPGFDDSSWANAIEVSYDGQLVASPSEPVRIIEWLAPKSVKKLAAGSYVVDFGQNSNGWVQLKNLGPRGNKITLTHGEWLDETGAVTLKHLGLDFPGFPPKDCHQIDSVISDGDPASYFEPRYTTHGFQFVQIDGLDGELEFDDIRAAVVHTDMARTGHFASSDDRLNWLHEATTWSFRGNACDIPTDCPTRERAGWTGDWQIFIESAAFLYDIRGFNRKYLTDVRYGMKPTGEVPFFSPTMQHDPGGFPESHGSAGWGDVVVHAPWIDYSVHGDEDILRENFDAMTKWVDFALTTAASRRHPDRAEQPAQPHEQYIWDTSFHFGEWLEAGAPQPDLAETLKADQGIIATAYLYRSSRDLAKIAKVLRKADEVEHYEAIAANVRQAWQAEYLLEDGSLTKPTQANYARALHFGLVPENQVAKVAARLNELIVAADYHLSTGFLATPLLLPALADAGYADTAFKLLFQNTEPSWMVMRERGATTIWENWNGVSEVGVPEASLNHYSKGAVISFLHQYLVGLKATSPGYKTFSVEPLISPEVDWAEISYRSVNGLIEVEWRRIGDRFTLEVLVPGGCSASVKLPNGEALSLAEGEHALECTL